MIEEVEPVLPPVPTVVGILIFDDVEVLDFCGPFEVFASAVAQDPSQAPLFRVVTIAERPGIVRCSGGLLVQPHHTIHDHPPLDLLVVPGGQGTRRERSNRVLLDWIATQHLTTTITASVCTGAFLLAANGFLDGDRATTHWASIDWLREHHPAIDVRDTERVVDEGRIVTSAGVSAGIDMALYLVARLYGGEIAAVTARDMEYDWQLAGPAEDTARSDLPSTETAAPTQRQRPLETGWLADTPATDTLVRRWLFNWIAATEAVAAMMGGRVLRRDDLVATDLGRPADLFNSATLLQPLEPAKRDEVLAALDEFYGFADGAGRGEVTLSSVWPTPDLQPGGWQRTGHPPLHLLPPGATAPPPPPELRIEAVTNDIALRAFEEVIVEGFPLTELQPLVPGAWLDARVLNDGRLRLWVGWKENRAVSAAMTFVDHGVNDVLLVATIRQEQRQSYGGALAWRAAQTDPTLPAVLLSSDIGRPLYDRMGFVPLIRLTLWHRTRTGEEHDLPSGGGA